MNNKLIIAFPGNETLTNTISRELEIPGGEIDVRHFPDGESYVRLVNDVNDKEVIVVATLHYPNDKFLPLLFLLQLLRDSRARKITLVAPYLAYMRQDKQFKPGEAITSNYFSKLITPYIDHLITVDPHLHRIHSMAELYAIPATVLHAADLISDYVRHSIVSPVLIGPDSESEQWVSAVAFRAQAPYLVLEKHRHGERSVDISVPQVDRYRHHTPVLIDDIISTARTMIETVEHLKITGMRPPVCIGVHAVFSDQSFSDLVNAGPSKIVTCNTIPHPSNAIDLSSLIVETLRKS